MNDPQLNLVRTAIENYVDPFLGETLGEAHALGETLGEAHAVDQVLLREGRVSVRLRFGFPVGGYADTLTEALRAHIEAVAGGLSVDLELTAEIHAHAVQRPLKPLAGVRNIIAVASAKAG